jgi:hypothetical protein
VISPGEFFFFKTHAPDSRIVGGGILAGWELLPLSAAWAFYGPGNGAASLGEALALLRTIATSLTASRPPEPGRPTALM